MFNNLFKLKINHIKVFIFLSFFWVSINTGSKYLILDYKNHLNYETLINLLRSLLPYFALIYFFIKRKEYINNFFINFDLVFLFFFIYGLSQLSGLIYTSTNLHEHYWVICLFAIIFFFKNTIDQKNFTNLKIIYFINKFYIIILFSFFIIYTFKENLFSEELLYHSKSFKLQFSGDPFPRSSGLSRMCLILFIFLNSIYFTKKLSEQHKFYILIINSLLIFILFTLQSRSSIIFFIFFFILINIFFDFQKNIKKRILFFLFIIMIPFFLSLSYPYFKYSLIKKNLAHSKTTIQNNEHVKIFRKDLLGNNKNLKLQDKIDAISNNRINAWKYLLDIYFYGELSDEIKQKLFSKKYTSLKNSFVKKKNYFTGFGPQADRNLMYNKSKKNTSPLVMGPFGAHASNVFVYSLICSGFFGLISIILINLIIFYKILVILRNKKKINFHLDYVLSSSIFILLFLLFRGLFENSYGVFSVDLILFFSSYTVLQNVYRKISE